MISSGDWPVCAEFLSRTNLHDIINANGGKSFVAERDLIVLNKAALHELPETESPHETGAIVDTREDCSMTSHITLFECKDLHVEVEGKQVVAGLAKINSGEVHAIMGPNGSGNHRCQMR